MIGDNMITGYSIKKETNEEILILHINYDQEFGLDFKDKHKHSSMRKEINRFIRSNKVKFTGRKIILMFGGIALGTLLLTKPDNKLLDDNYVYVTDDIIPYTEVIKTEDKNTSNEVSESNKTEVVEEQETTKPESNKTSTKNPSTNNSNNAAVSVPPVIETPKENTSNEQIIKVYRSNGTVLQIALEEYLVGVVGAEMPAAFNSVALEAQSIVARTYALKKLANNQKITDSVSTQAYKDNNQLKQQWGSSYDKYYTKVKNAVTATKGITIKYNGNYIDAVYHSTSNGKTEDAISVWGNSIPYLKSVDSSWDLSASSYLRVVDKELLNVLNILGLDLNNNPIIEVISRTSSGRINQIKIGTKVYQGVELRNLLGLRSTDFDINVVDGVFKITTRGYGHGVGMSQYGANGMANSGYNYHQILTHYYQGVTISK